MKTSEYLIYGTIIFLLYKLYKNTQSGENIDQTTNIKNLPVINFPPFATVTPTYWTKTQVQPTPAEVLSPEQLKFYNAKMKKSLKNSYTC
jgi:hypothetical protein